MSYRGEVAFKAERDPEFGSDEGLFSGTGGAVTTHYLNSADVSLGGEQKRFGGNDCRPSINNGGDIAFDESVQPDFDGGFFVGREGTFRTIEAPDPNRQVGEPVLNDSGAAGFETSFFDENGRFVTAIVKDDGPTQTTVADTNGPFGFFGLRPPSLNSSGNVAFAANPMTSRVPASSWNPTGGPQRLQPADVHRGPGCAEGDRLPHGGLSRHAKEVGTVASR